MEAINSFKEIFLEVWNDGVFGVNASEIIIGIVIFLLWIVYLQIFSSTREFIKLGSKKVVLLVLQRVGK